MNDNINIVIEIINDNEIHLKLRKDIYASEAILETSYKFTDQCYLFVGQASDEIYLINFKKKVECAIALKEIVDSFCNELIDQQVRIITEKKFSNIRDEIVKKAFFSIS